MTAKLPDLPKSDDREFWGDEADTYIGKPTPISICPTHGRDNWTEHKGYLDNHDGTASCKYCPWGLIIPGYMRIHNEKVFDLRKA